MCKQQPGHGLLSCKTFLEMVPAARAEEVNRIRNGFRCLGRGHYSSNCRKPTACEVDGCKYNHHSLLHGAPRVNSIKTPSQPTLATGVIETEDAVSSNALGSKEQRTTVLLSVLPVLIRSKSG